MKSLITFKEFIFDYFKKNWLLLGLNLNYFFRDIKKTNLESSIKILH
jgi:hypothetical protein